MFSQELAPPQVTTTVERPTPISKDDHVEPLPGWLQDELLKAGYVGKMFLVGDKVTITGCTDKSLNGTCKIQSNEENKIMSNQSSYALKATGTRRVVTVRLFDDDPGLPVDNCLVGEYTGIVTEDNDQVTIQQVLLDYGVAEEIDIHNKIRAEVVNGSILQNTGREVMLRPIRLKDLRIEVVC
jgi:hypothetical protein